MNPIGKAPSDESNYGQAALVDCHMFSELLLHCAAGPAEKHECLRLRVCFEARQKIEKRGTYDRIPPDADTSTLADARLREQICELGEHSAAPRHNCYRTFPIRATQRHQCTSGHTKAYHIRRYNTQAVRTNHRCRAISCALQNRDDVSARDPFGHDHNQLQAGIQTFCSCVDNVSGRH